MNSESSDVILAWLGRRSLPRNYYELLSVRQDETAPEVIDAAADELLKRLQRAPDRDGAQQRRWKHLIAQIEVARSCLMDPEQRRRYDARLHRLRSNGNKLEPERTPLPASHSVDANADPMAPVNLPRPSRSTAGDDGNESQAPAIKIDSEKLDGRNRSNAKLPRVKSDASVVTSTLPLRTARRQRGLRASAWPPGLIYGAIGLCFALTLGGFYGVMRMYILPRQAERDAIESQLVHSSSDLAVDVVDGDEATISGLSTTVDNSRLDPFGQNAPPADLAVPAVAEVSDTDLTLPTDDGGDSTAMLAQMPTADDAEIAQRPAVVDEQVVDEKLRTIQQLLKQRQLSAAEQEIRSLKAMTAESASADRVARFELLVDYVSQFWDGYAIGRKGVTGIELTVGRSVAIVVEAAPNRTVIRAAGRNLTYRDDELPPRLVLAIAERGFKRDAPSTPVFEAAYLLVEEVLTPDGVRDRLEEAATRGAELDDFAKVVDDWKRL
ncbi:MAG: hypothetical protein KDA92_01405 [Planctomycetales bacterium]|nr:hypothetical protein [Planctomycetales bacterium]